MKEMDISRARRERERERERERRDEKERVDKIRRFHKRKGRRRSSIDDYIPSLPYFLLATTPDGHDHTLFDEPSTQMC